MTNDYIRRQKALDAFGLSEKTRKYGGDHSGYDTRMLYEIQDTIESLEPADVAPVVHAHWIDGYRWQTCSKCRNKGKRSWKFCPNCGAKMDAQGEE